MTTTTPQAALLHKHTEDELFADWLDAAGLKVSDGGIVHSPTENDVRQLMRVVYERAKLQATQEPVQAGWAQSGSGDTLALAGSIIGAPAEINPEITQNRQEPAQAGELPDEREAFELELAKMPDWAPEFEKHRTWVEWLLWNFWRARATLSARKPLTLEQIKHLAQAEELLMLCDGIDSLEDIVRTIERHHGIGLEVKHG